MNPSFKPPATEEEFRKMAEGVTIPAANILLKSLTRKREQMLQQIDAEIAHYRKVIEYKEETS